MPTTHYEAPTTVAAAIRLLQDDPAARPLAGGTDLLVQMHVGARSPSTVVDLKRIPDLVGVSLDGKHLRMGAATNAAEISENEDLLRFFPGLAEAIRLVGSTQIQGRASVGGNLCNGSPAADTVAPLIVNRARAIISGRAGERSVAAEEFITAPGKTVLAPGELLVAIEIPLPAPRSADAYLRLIPRTEMDIAVAGAAVSVTLDGAGVCTAARVALSAVAATPLLVTQAADALVGSRLDDVALMRASAAASAAARPIDDKRGSAEYRKTVVGVLVRRAAAIARARALARGA